MNRAHKIAEDDFSLSKGVGDSLQDGGNWLATWSRHEGKLTTRTGKTIKVDFYASPRFFENSDHLVLSTEGRSVAWPVEARERAEKVDLKAEFPEASR